MSKIELSDDLSILTGVSKLSLDNLADKASLCIGHNVLEALTSRENQCEIDIGIGILYIKMEMDNIKYKFIPSKKLEDIIASTVTHKESPIALKADKVLGERIENAYRALI